MHLESPGKSDDNPGTWINAAIDPIAVWSLGAFESTNPTSVSLVGWHQGTEHPKGSNFLRVHTSPRAQQTKFQVGSPEAWCQCCVETFPSLSFSHSPTEVMCLVLTAGGEQSGCPACQLETFIPPQGQEPGCRGTPKAHPESSGI